MFCRKRPRRQPNRSGDAFSLKRIAKRIAIAGHFPSQGKIGRLSWGGGGLFLCPNLVAWAIRNTIRANGFARIIRNSNPYFYSASGRFARIIRISDSRESPDSRELCESIRADHAARCRPKNRCDFSATENRNRHHRKIATLGALSLRAVEEIEIPCLFCHNFCDFPFLFPNSKERRYRVARQISKERTH